MVPVAAPPPAPQELEQSGALPLTEVPVGELREDIEELARLGAVPKQEVGLRMQPGSGRRRRARCFAVVASERGIAAAVLLRSELGCRHCSGPRRLPRLLSAACVSTCGREQPPSTWTPLAHCTALFLCLPGCLWISTLHCRISVSTCLPAGGGPAGQPGPSAAGRQHPLPLARLWRQRGGGRQPRPGAAAGGGGGARVPGRPAV